MTGSKPFIRSGRSIPSPLLGRSAEWDQLSSAVHSVREGGSRSVVVSGEAGIGKTRLIQELAGDVERKGFWLFIGQAEDLERLRPLGAVSDGMANFARRHGSQRPGGDDLVDVLSSPANILDASDRFIEFVEELALSRPTCVILEDLHWADADTISAARALTRRLAYLPILFVGTHRPHPHSRELLRLVDRVLAESGIAIELGGLDDQSVKELTSEIVGGNVGPQLEDMLKATSGNPLYAVELARALQDEGALRLVDGMADTAITDLPPTLRLTILRRLSQLSPEALELLKVAAVLGTTFHLHELSAVLGRPAAEIARGLDGPIAAKIIEGRDAMLAFRHDLIQQAIYEDMPSPIRASMHVDIGRLLRTLGVPPVRIAEHLIRGLDSGDPAMFDETIGLLTELRFSAPLVALALGEKALTLDGVPEQRRDELRRYMIWPLVMTGRRDPAERLGNELLTRPSEPMVEAMIRLIVAVVCSEDGRSRDAIAELEKLPVDDPRTPPAAARLMRIIDFAVRARAGSWERIPFLEQLITEARDADDVVGVTVGTGTLSAVRLGEGHVTESARLAEQYIQMEERSRSQVPTPYLAPALAYLGADRLNDARRACQQGRHSASEAGETAALAVYSGLESLICFIGGAWDEALGEALLALELIADGAGSSVMLVPARVSLAQISLRRDDMETAAHHVREVDRMISEKGPQWGMDLSAWTKALIHETSGDSRSALDAFREGWDAVASSRYLFGRPAFPDLVRLALASGDLEAAVRVTEEAEEGRRRAADIPSVIGTALRCRGLLEDDPDLLVAAVDAYRQCPRLVEKAAACEEAAKSLAQAGRTPDARALFEEALADLERVGAVHDFARLVAAMRGAGIRRGSRASRRRPATGWGALTPTEAEVARLTIEGLSNPKIAERLFVSKRTVQTHLSHIFGKLGISSRVELAAQAARRSTR